MYLFAFTAVLVVPYSTGIDLTRLLLVLFTAVVVVIVTGAVRSIT